MMKNRSVFLVLTLAVASIIPWLVVSPVLNDSTVVQDDFRQSMFWVWKYWDPELFPNDFIANIFQGGMDKLPLLDWFYRVAPVFTDDLLFYTKATAILLAIVTSCISYLFFEKLTKKPYLAFSFAMMISTTLWCTDHVSAMHARSFIWIFILLYIYLKELNKDISAAISTFISLFISPLAFLITLSMEGFDLLFRFFSSENRTKLFKSVSFIGSVINATIVIIFHKLIHYSSVKYPFDEVKLFTNEELEKLPELNPGGRHPIFGSSVFDGTWWNNEHWGLGIGFLEISKILIVAAVLLALYLLIKNFKIEQVILRSNIAFLFYASLVLYFLSQFLFPILYMPSRYLGIPLLIVSTAIVVLIVDSLLTHFFTKKIQIGKKSKNFEFKTNNTMVITGMILLSVFHWSYFKEHTFTRYVKMHPRLKVAFDALPKDSYIASHPLFPDISMAPVISKRKIFMSYEHAIPSFDKQVLAEIRRRNKDSFRMIYATSKEELLELMKESEITHLLVSINFYDSKYLAKPTYMNPYNEFLRELITEKKGNFYLLDFLKEHKIPFAIIERDSLEDGNKAIMNCKYKVFISDVDGVLNTGKFFYTEEGKIMKEFGADDNDALKLLQKNLEVRFISGDKRGFSITKKRVEEDMKFQLDLVSTSQRLDWIKERYNPEEVIYMGDGIFDCLVFDGVGYSIAPAASDPYTASKADYICSRAGGDRAVSEAVRHIMDEFFGGYKPEKILEKH